MYILIYFQFWDSEVKRLESRLTKSAITLEVTQLVRQRIINITDRETEPDGQMTDGHSVSELYTIGLQSPKLP